MGWCSVKTQGQIYLYIIWTCDGCLLQMLL